MPLAFVTGASGFVGANLVRVLLARGWSVRVLLRGAAPSLDGLPVERVAGDLFSPELAAAMEGCDGLFHTAAAYRLRRRDRDDVFRTNVDGTSAVLAAAARAGVRRVVHTSSVAAIGVRPDGPADERHQSPPERLAGAYKRSKYFAERAAVRAHQNGLDVVIVNPSTPIGPWDSRPTPTGEIVLRVLQGRIPAYVDTALNIVDVRDVAAGHLLAFERGRAGERYILGGENMSLRDLLRRIAAAAGVAAPRVRLPVALPLAYALVRERLLEPLGIPADVPVESVRMARRRMEYDTSKAVRELGLPRSPIARAIADAVVWYREHPLPLEPAHSEDPWRSLSSKP